GAPVHHRGGGRLRRQADGGGGASPARDVAAVRAREGRRRPEVDSLEGRVAPRHGEEARNRPWPIARRSSTTTTTRATSAPSPRRLRAWGPGSWERRSAATS